MWRSRNDADSRHGGPPADGEAAIRLTLVSVRRPATGYPPAAGSDQELLITMAPLPGTGPGWDNGPGERRLRESALLACRRGPLMELVVLGCQAGMPASGQASSGYLVVTSGSRILLDCGPGVATALSAHGGPGPLDAVVISHLHPDHCYDLLPIAIMARRAGRPVPAAGACPPRRAGAAARPERAIPPGRWPAPDTPPHHALSIREYVGQVITAGDCTLALHGLRHVVPNCGIRVQSGPDIMAYTGDTGPDAALADLARDAGLLLAEATLAAPTPATGATCATDAAEAATTAAAAQLVLTHLAPPTRSGRRPASPRPPAPSPAPSTSPGQAPATRPLLVERPVGIQVERCPVQRPLNLSQGFWGRRSGSGRERSGRGGWSPRC